MAGIVVVSYALSLSAFPWLCSCLYGLSCAFGLFLKRQSLLTKEIKEIREIREIREIKVI
jgi:hypothetical protein